MALPIDISHKKVIVAPLCWGLGHATRCIPIIRQLLHQHCDVAIASDGIALELLKAEFPHLKNYKLPSYDVKYKYESMVANIMLQGPKVLNAINEEQKAAENISQEWSADIIISDNRLKFRAIGIHNIYITHQLNIKAGNTVASLAATKLHQKYYSAFDEIWVPDHSGEKSLAGELSQKTIYQPVTYLGPLSRFQKKENTDDSIDHLIILSGPEPQRTILEQEIINIMKSRSAEKITMVRGTTTPLKIGVPEFMNIIDLATSNQLQQLLHNTKHVISRAGYTSIMDFTSLEKTATLIPTPGQTEQEYLAKRLHGKYGFKCIKSAKELIKI